MRNKIKAEDILALLKLLAPKKYSLSIFDPLIRLESFKGIPGEDINQNIRVLINLGEKIECYKQYRLDEFDLIINFGSCRTNHLYQEKINFKMTGEGSLRWLYKTQNLRHVLSTYSTNNLRSKFVRMGVKLLGALRLEKFFRDGTISIHSNIELPYHDLVTSFDSCIVFMGTPGFQRKLTLAKIEGKSVESFIKIPLTYYSEINNRNEKSSLDSLRGYRFDNIKFPTVAYFDKNNNLFQSNANEFVQQSNNLVPAYQNSLIQMAEKTLGRSVLHQTDFLAKIKNNLNLVDCSKFKYLESHKRITSRMFDALNTNETILTSLCHGDFTPWNLKFKNDQSYIFDWEYSRDQMPVLYDLFHFIIQSHVYTKQSKSIRLNELLREVRKTFMFKWIQTKEIKITQYLELYLLHQLSYHLSCVKFNDVVSNGLKRQLDTLYRLSSEVERIQKKRSFRISFLQNFQDYLIRTEDYALMKFNVNHFSEIDEDSDIDICVNTSSENEILSYFKRLKWRADVHIVKRSFMTKVKLRFFDGSILYIDLIKTFKRKSFKFLEAKDILQKAYKLPNGLKVPQPEHDFEYAFLFYNLNDSNIPEKYFDFFSKEGRYEERISNYINSKYLISLTSYSELFQLEKDGRGWLKMITRHTTRRNPFKLLISYAQYLLDTIRSFWNDRGFVITFSGVDGSGKSTVIGQFKDELRSVHRRDVVLLRHRPRLLPILSAMKYGGVSSAEKRAGEVLPRKGKAKPGLGSILRFGYYYADYLFGQTYIFFKYVLRGKIVLYDRYYFDFIIDAKRSNISVSPSLVRSLYSLIYKPKLNFLLWSNAEEVYARKPEVEVGQIRHLNKNYKNLFSDLSRTSNKSVYRVIHNQKIESTLQQIMLECRAVA